ncbi:cold-shock protein [Halarcobacter anaerophilus]|uniref:Cold-shock protein n=1 Tax=Halarcobacter anaerophilus TaxID=877500 RepID=A0A4Q0XX61_9BACT|nr:cold-shock protein [Halarcobacter anaerophilus]QDF28826.1 cold shock protein [Halarcobacter anaerophilus]RXJ61264.1 cold-shock protein [Halarcobacter anaerophilus]
MSNRYNGTVKWFNNEKGFGFIQLEDGTKDIFVHYREVNNTGYERVSLDENQKVSFLIGNNEKGDFAQDVEKI